MDGILSNQQRLCRVCVVCVFVFVFVLQCGLVHLVALEKDTSLVVFLWFCICQSSSSLV
jgi:hypothetical protein